ncbi:AfsR/SARP family transcriptional regulator [Streptomyces sp. NP160]|nr:AfsR/SARP family transcriptional regulator [Streptomyces sp. NP160]
MRFEVLGALRVLDGVGADVGTGAPQQRAVLAALLADAGRTVSTAALVDAVWGEDAGDAAGTSLQVVVSRLRKRLGPAGPALLVTAPPGYRLQVDDDDVDARRFGALVARARERFAQNALVQARADVTAALVLWRGEPYADVRPGVVDAEVARLVSLRLTAVELAAELDLALGRHAQVAGRLPSEVAEHPLQEGLRGSLVLALYRCGEQARALEVYEQGREGWPRSWASTRPRSCSGCTPWCCGRTRPSTRPSTGPARAPRPRRPRCPARWRRARRTRSWAARPRSTRAPRPGGPPCRDGRRRWPWSGRPGSARPASPRRWGSGPAPAAPSSCGAAAWTAGAARRTRPGGRWCRRSRTAAGRSPSPVPALAAGPGPWCCCPVPEAPPPRSPRRLRRSPAPTSSRA